MVGLSTAGNRGLVWRTLLLTLSISVAALLFMGAILTNEPQIAKVSAQLPPPYYYQVTTGEDEPPDIPFSNCLSSTGPCSLRAAVTSANQDLNHISKIFLPTRIYTLTYGSLPIERAMEFVGSGAEATIIHRPDVGVPGSIVTVMLDADLTLLDVTLTGGVASQGGAIENYGEVTLIRSTVTANDAVVGGGIWNNGTLTLVDSVVSQNTGLEGDGGITNYGTATLIQTTVSNNYGNSGVGGIVNDGTLSVYSSTISSNSGNDGGGLSNWGDLTVEASTISSNEAYGSGGGLYNGAGQAELLNSTLSGNVASDGGAINNMESTLVWLASVTIVNNSADYYGGGVNGAGIVVKNTILSANTAGTMGDNCWGDSGSVINTLVSSNDCGWTGTVIVADPLLDDLQDNGGPTFTHAFSTDSPALNAVPVADCTDFSGMPLATDQRGVARLEGAACDIGAFEFNFNLFLPLVQR